MNFALRFDNCHTTQKATFPACYLPALTACISMTIIKLKSFNKWGGINISFFTFASLKSDVSSPTSNKGLSQ
ncbi:hypothetical protein FAM09_29945 [Niastella caeni]|uniref:Uncharacterized protein n=1 Tax=Niastella caeni TaxID=2569763 RepID=A0A4S8HCX9_9BACT|nr:hypothetical protein [Niastella caeni]THU30382.1 hypothetical protein FAM09_29945 [Niastella caeni]